MFDLITSGFAICFLIGLLLTVVSLFGGVGHFHTGGHSLGHFDLGSGSHGSLGSSHGGTVHVSGHHTGPGEVGDGVSFLNFSSLTVFITWFGAVGFCLRLYGITFLWLVLGLALIGGVLGAYAVYLFLAKFLLKGQSKPLRENDTYMPGTVARVTSQINAGGAGEIVYSQLGTRRSCGARSQDGSLIPRGTKVVVLKYEKGMALVKSMDSSAD